MLGELIFLRYNQIAMSEISKAVKILKKGGVVAYPSDTYYALGANIYNDQAIARVMKAKGLNAGVQPLPVAVASILQVEDIVQLGSDHREIIEKIWPGPVMFLLPKRGSVSSLLSGPSNLIGVVQFQNSFAEALIQKAGFPITAASANLVNQDEVFSASEVRVENDLLVKGVCPYGSRELTIVDLFNGRIIQEGIWGEKIEKFLY